MDLAVLSLSLLLQVVSAILGWRLVRKGRNRLGWILAASAMTLVTLIIGDAVVRSIALPGGHPRDFPRDWAVLLLSLVVTWAFGGMFMGFSNPWADSEDIRRAFTGKSEKGESHLEGGQALQALVGASPVAIMALDPEGRVTLWNPAAERIFGWSEQEVLGKPLPIVPADRQEEFRKLWERSLAGESFSGFELQRQRKDGSLIDISLSTAPLLDASGRLSGIMGVAADVTQTKVAEKAVHQLAYYDPLTGLPNRLLLRDRLGLHLVQANREGHLVGVIFLDLDHFKLINDTLGHAAGDELLRVVAKRLKAAVRKSDTVARLGGDEFVILLPTVNHPEDATAISQKILAILAEPFELWGQQLSTSASLGVALYPADGQDVESLLRDADLAMYRAKEEGRNTSRFFSPEMNRRAQEMLALEADLRRALESNEFVLHFQPQVNLVSNHVIGAEVLLRWQHPKWGRMAPGTFISLAEESGLIIPIGLWVLRHACLQARRWQEQGLPELRLALNLSPRQLLQKELPDVVAESLRENGLDPALLELEVTEKAVRDQEEPFASLQQLRSLGVGFALDNFGTGPSSIPALSRIPLRRLKIDISLIRPVPGDRESAAVIRTIVAMARALGVAVLAEGVESEAQRAFLLRNGCEQGQGFLLGRPLPAEDFATLMRGE